MDVEGALRVRQFLQDRYRWLDEDYGDGKLCEALAWKAWGGGDGGNCAWLANAARRGCRVSWEASLLAVALYRSAGEPAPSALAGLLAGLKPPTFGKRARHIFRNAMISSAVGVAHDAGLPLASAFVAVSGELRTFAVHATPERISDIWKRSRRPSRRAFAARLIVERHCDELGVRTPWL